MPYTGLAHFSQDTKVFFNPSYELGQIPTDQLPESFIRSVTLVPPSFSFCSLERLLKRTDAQLDRIADYIGGRVVTHKWGVIGGDSERYRFYNHLFASAYYLVAEVNRVVAADKPIGTDGSIVRGIARFHDRPTIHRKLSDIRLEQCMYGFEVNSANPVAAPLVVDIEPIYREQVMSM